MINIPQVLLNRVDAHWSMGFSVFGYICRMKREADAKMSMVKLAMGQAGSADPLFQMAWLRATFLYWERESIREFVQAHGEGMAELLPLVDTPEQAADLASQEWSLEAGQARELRERVHTRPRVPRIPSYPMALREPVFPLIPSYLEEYYAKGREYVLPPVPERQRQRNLESMRNILDRYLVSGRSLEESRLMKFLHDEVLGGGRGRDGDGRR